MATILFTCSATIIVLISQNERTVRHTQDNKMTIQVNSIIFESADCGETWTKREEVDSWVNSPTITQPTTLIVAGPGIMVSVEASGELWYDYTPTTQ